MHFVDLKSFTAGGAAAAAQGGCTSVLVFLLIEFGTISQFDSVQSALIYVLVELYKNSVHLDDKGGI